MKCVRLRSEDALLIRAPNWLGDFVMAEPTLRAIATYRRKAGHTGATRVVAPRALLALLDEPGLEPLALEDAGSWEGHDVVLLLTGSFRSAWRAFRAGIQGRIGWYRDGRSLLLSAGMRPARSSGRKALGCGRPARILPRPYGATCVELVGLLGIPVPETEPRLTVDSGARQRVRARLAAAGVPEGEAFFAVQSGRREGSAKGVPEELLAASLLALPAGAPRAVLVGGPGEEESVRRTARLLEGKRPAISLMEPPLSLGELLALFAEARGVLTGDCGPRHLAQAAKASIACLFGPTDPRHTADHLGRTVVLRHEVACGPCHLERCPEKGDAHLACWGGIAAQDVARALVGFA